MHVWLWFGGKNYIKIAKNNNQWDDGILILHISWSYFHLIMIKSLGLTNPTCFIARYNRASIRPN